MGSRAGRKRRMGERTKGGRLKAMQDVPPGIVKREQWAMASGVLVGSANKLYDPEFGYVLGRLNLTASDEFPTHFLEASRKFAETLARYDRLAGGLPRTVKSPDYDRGYRGRAADTQRQQDPDLVRESVDDLKKLRNALSPKHFASIYNVAILNMAVIGSFERVTLRDALESLSAYFGLCPAEAAKAAA